MKKLRKLLGFIFFTAVFAVLLAIPALASYEDGQDCPTFGHYHWDEYMCDGCGGCSEDCTEPDCWMDTHCHSCGNCYVNTGGFCEECGNCGDCYYDYHCPDCGKCMYGDPDNHCKDCFRCDDCDYICSICGLCASCYEDDSRDLHCPLCGNCYEDVKQCGSYFPHCEDCCDPCAICERCIGEGSDIEMCEECLLCIDCCHDRAIDAGGEGDICVESAEWEEHICVECYNYFDSDADFCESCDSIGIRRCLDCCAAASECSEQMCPNDPDYEDHFCIDCGRCFCGADLCHYCDAEGEMRCEDCSIDLADALFDCADGYCIYASDFDEHLADEHEGYSDEHNATPRNSLSFDKNYHYRECRFCVDEAHYTGKAAHSFNKNKVCVVCGCRAGVSAIITKQPTVVKAKVSDYYANKSDNYHIKNNIATFRVDVVSTTGEEPGCCWYVNIKSDVPNNKYDVTMPVEEFRDSVYFAREAAKGADIPDFDAKEMHVPVPFNACHVKYTFWCDIGYENDIWATSEKIVLDASHNYVNAIAQNVRKSGEVYVLYGKKTDIKSSDGHIAYCAGCVYDDDLNEKEWKKRSSKPVAHTYGKASLFTNETGTTFRVTDCTMCGFRSIVATHTHSYTVLVEEKCSEKKHVFKCSYEGCDKTITAAHRWSFHIAGYPTATEPGAMNRQCDDCTYTVENPNVVWDNTNALIQSRHTSVSRMAIKEGETFRMSIIRGDFNAGKRAIGWKFTYEPMGGMPVDVTDLYTKGGYMKPDFANGGWIITATFGGYGGGILTVQPNYLDCTDHSETEIINQRDPVCTTDGYSGDLVCSACMKVIKSGYDIPAPGKHTGNITIVPGTSYRGTCTEKGYEGDKKCSDCGRTFPGSTTGYQHDSLYVVHKVYATCDTPGYTGDALCVSCDKVVERGRITPPEHTPTADPSTAVKPTCTDTGREANTVCRECGMVVKYGKIIPALGHNFVEDKANSTEKTTAYKCSRTGCPAVKYENVKVVAHAEHKITVEGGYAYLAGGSITCKAKNGEIIYLKANVPAGKQFKEWEVVSGGITISLPNLLEGAYFRMPNNDVEINAVFEDKAATPTDPGSGSGTGSGTGSGSGSGSGSTDTELKFIDVKKSDWFYEDVLYVFKAGLMNGTDPDKFSPEDSTTRGMIVTILYRLEGQPKVSGKCAFKDIASGSYYEKAIIWASSKGIVNGYGDGEFGPEDNITREQMAVIFWRCCNCKGMDTSLRADLSGYSDAGKISSYALDAMMWANASKLMGGNGDGTLSPAGDATRAQAAAMLHRICEK